MKRLYFLVLVCLAGCAGRVIDWAEDTVYQGVALPSFASMVKAYERSIALYDQFDTAAIFDALWIADPVRRAYAQQYASKYGKSIEQQEAIIQTQIMENKPYIRFYVLSLYDIPLKEHDGVWALFLEIDGKPYAPVEIKSVELSPEYKLFFGKRYNRFKVPYLVTFNAYNAQGNPLLTDSTEKMVLVFRTTVKEGRLVWDLHDLQKIPAEHVGGCCTPLV